MNAESLCRELRAAQSDFISLTRSTEAENPEGQNEIEVPSGLGATASTVAEHRPVTASPATQMTLVEKIDGASYDLNDSEISNAQGLKSDIIIRKRAEDINTSEEAARTGAVEDALDKLSLNKYTGYRDALTESSERSRPVITNEDSGNQYQPPPLEGRPLTLEQRAFLERSNGSTPDRRTQKSDPAERREIPRYDEDWVFVPEVVDKGIPFAKYTKPILSEWNRLY